MHVLVTGGLGFIGRRLCARLLADGHRVTVVDRADGDPEDGAALLRGDLGDPAVADLAAAVAPDAVAHLAARVGLGLDPGDLPAFVADNDLATAQLLTSLWRAGFDGRLALASSMVVYGEGAYRCVAHGPVRPGPRTPADLDAGRFEPGCPDCGTALGWATVDEAAPIDPRSGYAATKAAQEHLVSAWARETGCSVVALRYHNVYGPGLPLGTPYAGVAALFRTRLLEGEPTLVFEDGGQTRDFVHVDDVARATALAATGAPLAAAPGALVPVNVSSGRPVTILEVAEVLTRTVGGPAPIVTGRWRAGDVRHIVASPKRAADLLGFDAAVALEDGMRTLGDA